MTLLPLASFRILKKWWGKKGLVILTYQVFTLLIMTLLPLASFRILKNWWEKKRSFVILTYQVFTLLIMTLLPLASFRISKCCPPESWTVWIIMLCQRRRLTEWPRQLMKEGYSTEISRSTTHHLPVSEQSLVGCMDQGQVMYDRWWQCCMLCTSQGHRYKSLGGLPCC